MDCTTPPSEKENDLKYNTDNYGSTGVADSEDTPLLKNSDLESNASFSPEDDEDTDDGSAQIFDRRAMEQHYALVAGSVLVFLVSVSFIPPFTKKLQKKFYRPITITWVQLTFCWVVLSIYNILYYFIIKKRVYKHQMKKYASGEISQAPQKPSWVLDSRVLYKVKYIFIVGFCFGLKFFITNLGLSLIDTDVHLLLQATGFFWTVVLTYLFNKEKPTWIEIGCCVGSIVGSALISMQMAFANVGSINHLLPGLLINLLTAFMEGLTIVALRAAAKRFLIDDVKSIGVTAPELTAIKLFVSSMTVLPFILLEVFETGILKGQHHTFAEDIKNIDSSCILYFFIIAILTMIFQVNITVLASLSGAVTVGLMSDIKVVPQVLVNDLLQLKIDLSVLKIIGGVLVAISGLCYALSKHRKLKKTVNKKTKNKQLFLKVEKLVS